MGRRLAPVVTVIAGLCLAAACHPGERDDSSGGEGTGAAPTTTAPSTTASGSAPSGGASSPAQPTETARVFDVERMNRDVRRVLTDDYALSHVGDVACPRNRPVEPGTRFACYVDVAGDQRTVMISVQNDDGRYEVGRVR